MTTEEILDSVMRRVYRACITLHATPKEIMTMTNTEMDGILQEQMDVQHEMATGRPMPRVYEWERENIRMIREEYNR